MADVPISNALIDAAQFQVQSVPPPTPGSGLVRLFRGVTGWQEKKQDGSVADVGGGGGAPLFYMSGVLLAPAVVSGGGPGECNLFAGLLQQSGAFAVSGSADLFLPVTGAYLAIVTLIAPVSTGNTIYIIESSAAADLNYDDGMVVFAPSAAELGPQNITVMTTVTGTAGQTVGLGTQRIVTGAGGETADVRFRLYLQKL